MIVGMHLLKVQLEIMRLHKCRNNVSKILTKMQGIYCMLKENGHALDSYCRYLYTSLGTGPNADFYAFMDRLVDDIQSRCRYNCDITCDELIAAARTKYNNMVEDISWGKVDPQDAKIFALTTKLEKLENNRVKPLVNATNSGGLGGKQPSAPKLPSLEKWCKKFDGANKVVMVSLTIGVSIISPRT